jgi:hypothetical protein
MCIKGSNIQYLTLIKHPQTYILREIKCKKSAIVGETIAFSICNKLFKPLGLPSGRVKSHEGLLEMIPTNMEALCC